jgi:AcrR family transcriptional regulator
LRVTAATKLATRYRILEAARAMFSERGFQGVTTRDIARAAGVATGTLFNYFPTKEAIALGLAFEALTDAHAGFARRRRRGETLDEELFALIAAELRSLKPHRDYFMPVIEATMGPDVGADDKVGGSVRAVHWTVAGRILADHGITAPPSFVTMHLYWTLYIGVLAFWSSDTSPKQEDTLAVLDHSLKVFASSLPAANLTES